MVMQNVMVLTQTDDFHGPVAASFLRDYSTDIRVVSAAIEPSDRLDPIVVKIMKECMIDLELIVPKLFDGNIDLFDFVVAINFGDKELKYGHHRLFRFEVNFPLNDINDYRRHRDFVRNEMFLIYRDVLRKCNS
jgi:Low molecular weight phosphotyrosine protein phosphatase.